MFTGEHGGAQQFRREGPRTSCACGFPSRLRRYGGPSRQTLSLRKSTVLFSMQLNQVTLPAHDVERSVAFYSGLGLRIIVSALPRYARLECPEGGSTFSLHQVSERPAPSEAVVYFECEDLDAKVCLLQTRGYTFTQEPKDENWLWREARLQDPSGNVICLYWAGENRRHPPWRVPA